MNKSSNDLNNFDAFKEAVNLCLNSVKVKNNRTGDAYQVTGFDENLNPMLSNPALEDKMVCEDFSDFSVVKK